MSDFTGDPRKAASLEEAAKNDDGTWNGVRALSFLSEALFPGKGISAEEVQRIHDQVKRKNAGL